ncbi:MAG TPA: methyltransferase domain-containing protein [Methylophilaceae bacterium]|nr:methyltransferase domain-containing protein [Methylophilaceae bacterium]
MSIANQQEWLSSPLGDYLQAQEQSIFDEAVGDVFGFNAIQVGMLQMDLLRNSRIPFSIRANLNPGQIPGQLLCDSVQLPLLSNSIDLLLLPHGLDFSTNPQQTLREAERVLVAEGHIMITGFNPVSSWGLKHMLGKNGNYPWNSSFLSLLRVKDWLALLGFEMVTSQMTCYSPPLSKAAWLQRFQFMDKVGGRWWPMMGGVYFIVAKKKVVGMRLIRPNWNKAKFKPSLVATPSQKGDCQKTGEGQD